MVQTIGDYAFVLCTSLTEISLPEVTSIGTSAFVGCSNLESYTIGSELEAQGGLPDNLWSVYQAQPEKAGTYVKQADGTFIKE
jgi:hypothetical protein